MLTRITDLFGAAQLAMQKPKPSPGVQDDQSDFQGPGGRGGGPQGGMGGAPPPGSGGNAGGGGGVDPNTGAQMAPPEVQAAPYMKLLTKLGYEYQGSDEELSGGPIGTSFTGQDGDTIMIKPDGSWTRIGPGAQRSQGKSSMDLGTALVKDSLAQGDDTNHHAALRRAGYNKIHKDAQGNSYYKHPQTGKTVTVEKSGRWASSAGSGKGAGKLSEFLGNEQMENEDPMVQQNKLKQQQLKQQGVAAKAGGGPAGPGGTRGGTGTRRPGAGAAGARMGGRGGF
jgi:hypothetical protein